MVLVEQSSVCRSLLGKLVSKRLDFLLKSMLMLCMKEVKIVVVLLSVVCWLCLLLLHQRLLERFDSLILALQQLWRAGGKV